MPINEQQESQKQVVVKAPKQRAPASKRFLDISEIRDGVVVMKDGTLRKVILVSSINFYLKGEDEQDAIISAYVAFLNGLESPIQIVVQSRTLNIDGYMQDLKEREEKQTNELLRNQTSEYRDFLKQLIQIGNIMDRKYFVVVPYNPLNKPQKSFFSRLSDLWSPGASIKLKEEEFKKRKYDLDVLVSRIVSGLTAMSLQITELDTQGLIELYYDTYNPDIASISKLTNVDNLQVE